MGLTTLPTIGSGQPLGPTKSDARTATDLTRQVAASEWNAAAVALKEVCEAVGLADGTTAGSVEADRVGSWPSTAWPTHGKLTKLSSVEHFMHTTDGLNGYAAVSSGTNAATGNDSTSHASRLGIAYARTGDTATGRAHFASLANTVRLGGGRFRLRSDVYIGNLSDGTETFRVFSGLHDSTPDTDGFESIGFRYTHSLNGGRWQFVTRSASVETVSDAGVLVAAATWYALELEVNAAGTEVKAWINGVLVATHTTNIPTGINLTAIMPIGIAKSVGLTSRAAYIDLAAWTFEPTAPV